MTQDSSRPSANSDQPSLSSLLSSPSSITVKSKPAPGPFNMGTRNQPLVGNSLSMPQNIIEAVDSVHEHLLPSDISPAQLYLTESGHLFHAGKICIVLVGLPARGKTHHAVSLTRYLRWLGVRAHAFHLGDYRRRYHKDKSTPDDYFKPKPSPETQKLRTKIVDMCLNDLNEFLLGPSSGQVAIYDAVNPTAEIRRGLKRRFENLGINVLFVECISTNDELVARNVRDVKLTSPDFQGYDYNDAVRSYLRRIELRIPDYETMAETELSFIKVINVCERFVLNRAPLGYLQNKIIFFLMNTHSKTGSVYFARAGFSEKNAELHYRNDEPLSPSGHEYAAKLRNCLTTHLKRHHEVDVASLHVSEDTKGSEPDTSISARLANAKKTYKTPGQDQWTTPTPTYSPVWEKKTSKPAKPQPISVWSSKRVRTLQTASCIAEGNGVQATQRTLLVQMNPGAMDGLEDAEIAERFPEDYAEHTLNPYHHRYPRAESYHDLAVRMEPLIMEIERTRGDLVIIAHESILRVLYGYLMACKVGDIPFLQFPKDEIIEVTPNAYYNVAKRIKIDGVEP